MKFSIIAACDKNRGIGKNNDLPWRLRKDLAHFQEVTLRTQDPSKQNVIMMGLNTWISLPENRRPLDGRLNVVLSRDVEKYTYEESEIEAMFEDGKQKEPVVFSSLDSAFDWIGERDDIENVFIIGGGSLYAFTINHPECEKVYLTEIEQEFDCDVFFPEIPEGFEEIERSDMVEEDGVTYTFATYEKL